METITQPSIPCSKAHWSARPLPLLLAVLITQVIMRIVQLACMLPYELRGISKDPGMALFLWSNAAIVAVQLLLVGFFYWLIRRKQKAHGCAPEVSWRINPAFWIGLALVLAYGALTLLRTSGPSQPYYFNLISVLITVLSTIVGTLFFVLLFPVFRQRYGNLKTMLLLAAAYGLLAVLTSLLTFAFNVVMTPIQYPQAGSELAGLYDWNRLMLTVSTSVLTAAAFTAVRSSLYLSAGRKVPGTWLLCTSVPWLLQLIHSKITYSASRELSGWTRLLYDTLPYSLVVFLLGAALLWALTHWKTWAEFGQSVRLLIHKARQTP